MEKTLAVEGTVANVRNTGGDANEAMRQEFIARAETLLSEAQASLNDARNALRSLAPDLIDELEQQISGIKALLTTLRSPAPVLPSAISSQLQTLARAVHNTSAEVAVAVAREAIGDMLAFAAMTAGLSTEATARITIRSGNITNNNIHVWARTFFEDDETPPAVRPAMARHMVHFLKTTEMGRAIVDIHNATPVETRVAVATKVEQHKTLFIRLLESAKQSSELHDLYVLLEEHKLRQTIAPELIPQYFIILDGTGDKLQAARMITEALKHKAVKQDEFMTEYAPDTERRLGIPSGFIASFGKSEAVWPEVAAIYKDKPRQENARKAWEMLENPEISALSWEAKLTKLKAAGHTDDAIRDANLLRVVQVSRVEYTFKIIAGLEVAQSLHSLSADKSKLLAAFNDPSKDYETRAKAILPLLKDVAPWYSSIPEKPMIRILTEMMEEAEKNGGTVKLGQGKERDFESMAMAVGRDLAGRRVATALDEPLSVDGSASLAAAHGMLAGRVAAVATDMPPQVLAKLPQVQSLQQMIT